MSSVLDTPSARISRTYTTMWCSLNESSHKQEHDKLWTRVRSDVDGSRLVGLNRKQKQKQKFAAPRAVIRTYISPSSFVRFLFRGHHVDSREPKSGMFVASFIP